ncbi:membrane protein insertase YidC [bacterium]|nr:membrane protein insertase YidC [candidate division CSSED10-310 bacterium]
MEKRVLLAVVLSLAILLLYQAYFVPPPPEPPPKREIEAADVPSTLVDEGGATDLLESGQVVIEPQTDVPDLEDLPIEPAQARDITIASRKYTAIISTRGACLTGWEMNEFAGTEGKPLEFIDPAEGRHHPGDVVVGESEWFNTCVFESSDPSDTMILDQRKPAVTLTFQAANNQKLQLTKRYTFYHDTILADLDVQISNRSAQPAGGTALIFLPDKIIRDPGDNAKNRFARSGPSLLIGNRLEQPKLKKLQGLWVYPQPVRWVAVEENFFFAGLVPVDQTGKAFILPTEFDERSGKALRASVGYQFGSGMLEPGERRKASFHMVLGPKKYDELKSMNIGIENIVNFGWITWLGKLFYYILIETTKIVKNYGLSIIILTIAIKIILLPLSHMSMKSMKKMQEIQPQMKEIQQRYRKDARKQQEELQKLYKRHGANPMSGCLPLLVQFPVFIALYQVLMNSIEMRGAPFLWAEDLSQPDIPLVLIMGASMFIQQKMTPTTGDPRQAKMMMFMPVLFTAMFWSFPSGLVVYWLMNNILTIIQQYFMNVRSEDSSGEDGLKLKARTLKKLEEKGLSGDSDRE